jgi:anti-sigma regulatory factor (Ser/Thr protein kinase)
MTPKGLELRLSASAENVAIVRHAVAGLAEAVAMEAAAVADLKTVVTEACMNVVVHAYDEDAPGPLEVDAYAEADALVIVVRDRGAGIRPRADATHQSLRLGLPLIAALASDFEISGGPGRGTEVTMRMALSPNGGGSGDEAGGAETPPVSRATEMTMPAGELLGPVLSRVISILAARANLPVDRLSDAVLLGDAISARAPAEFADGVARVRAAMRIPEIGGSLERLADEIRVDREGDAESVVLRIGQAA